VLANTYVLNTFVTIPKVETPRGVTFGCALLPRPIAYNRDIQRELA